MKAPAKGRAVMYTYNDGSKTIQYSLGVIDSFGNLRTSEYSDGKGRHDTFSNWQEVEIVPVVNTPKDMTPCYVWDDIKPEIPHIRISSGELSNGMLMCYMPTEKSATSPWRNWKEIE